MKLKLLLTLSIALFSFSVFSQNINQPTDYEVCDTDGDGIVSVDLETKTPEILGDLDPNEYTVTYHVTQAGADQGTNALASPYTNIVNPQTLFVRVEENATANFETTTLTIITNALPVSGFAQDVVVCDEGEIDGFATFDLTLFNEEFLNGNANLTITYHESYSSAEQGINAIANPSAYTNTVPYSQTIYPRIEDLNTDCFHVSPNTALFLNVDQQLVLNAPTPYVICDDDGDGFATFDLSTKSQEILGTADPITFSVNYFETFSNADNNIDPLPFVYSNTAQFTQTIYVRVSNQFGECYQLTELQLVVETDCISASSVEAFICTEDLNIPVAFDLTSQETSMVEGQNPSDFTFAYYISETNAISENNAITNPDVFQVSGNSTIIYVRIEDNQSGNFVIVEIFINFNLSPQVEFNGPYTLCSGNELVLYPFLNNNNGAYDFLWNTGETSQEIIVNIAGTYTVTVTDLLTGCVSQESVVVDEGQSPILSEPSDIIACSGSGVFNLMNKLAEALNGLDEEDYNVGFYLTLSDMFSQVNPLPNVEVYQPTASPETIYIRVQNNDDACFSYVSFNIITENCPTIVPCDGEPINTTYCYEDNDTTAFAFESSDGQPLTVTFNAGSTEVDWDEVYVYDSDGTQINGLLYGNNGDFSGLVFQSSGSSITVQFNSDISNSCASGSTCCTEEFDFDVHCNSMLAIIDVNAFLDANSNTVFDTDELNFNHGYFTYEANNDGVINTVSSSTGNFRIIAENETDTYDITYNLFPEFADCIDITTSTFNDISVTIGDVVAIDFPVTEVQSCEDLAVYVINNSAPPRPGFSYINYLALENFGTTTISSGTVEYATDPQLEYNQVYAVNPNYTITATTTGFTVDFVNLQPGEVEYVGISLSCPVAVPLGEIVTNTATYLTPENDTNATNDYSTLSEIVVGSWDPNDKMESHGREILYDDFVISDEYLYYTIRFQNLGTADAITVRIEDELNSQLDEATFQMLRSSHDYVVTRTDNTLEWVFDNINLPAEQDDADGSNGFVYFKIKPKTGYAIDDIIPNTAAIYFDFNEPVITNTFETEFVEDVLSVSEFDLGGFGLFPNPAKELLNVKFNNSFSGNIAIYDIQGKLILDRNASEEKQMQINVSELHSGLYFVKLQSDSQEIVRKLVIE